MKLLEKNKTIAALVILVLTILVSGVYLISDLNSKIDSLNLQSLALEDEISKLKSELSSTEEETKKLKRTISSQSNLIDGVGDAIDSVNDLMTVTDDFINTMDMFSDGYSDWSWVVSYLYDDLSNLIDITNELDRTMYTFRINR